MAKLIPITAPIHITKANPSIIAYVMYYKLSIHFCPDFVLSQMAKLLLIISPSEKININPSIIILFIVILHNSISTICNDNCR